MEEAGSSIRIYIGGLGATVTANDLTKTFSAPNLGTVTAVDVIRSKGRSFAYLDFLPCSDKGLAKLFSTYNGCKWKGGSLRLEKAKEHYLQQLRREWDEDAQLTSNLHKEDGESVENVLHTVKSKKHPDMDKMQLNIFFPGLRKVKAVPFKGTGKHKYSFQRFAGLAPPTYFCDCDEHSGAQDVDKGHSRNDDTKVKEDSFDDHEKENENGEVNEHELTMMSSVMNKLFEREVFSEATRKCAPSTMTLKNVNATGDLVSAEDQSDELSDEDNLIINIVGGSKSNATTNQGLYNSKSRPQNLQTNKPKIIVPVGEKRKQLKEDKRSTVSNVAARKIRKVLPSGKNCNSKGCQTSDISVSRKLSDECENSAEPQNNVSETINDKPDQLQKSAKEGSTTEGDNSTFQSESDILAKPDDSAEDENNSSFQIKEPEVSAEGLSGSGKISADKSTKGASWLQKSSWTELVKGSGSSSFSISHILPQANFDKQEIQRPTVIDFSRPNQTTHVPLPQGQSNTVLLGVHEQINEASTSSASNKQPLAAKQASTDADETFAFVRTAASMKEYAKLKASLSGSLKKKGDKKDI